MSILILIEGRISELILKLAIPTILTNILATIFELVDAIFVGRINSEAFAGVTIAGSLHFLISTIGAGVSVGTVALVTRYCGAKKYKNASDVTLQSFNLGFIGGLLIGLFGFIYSPQILKLLGAKGRVFNYALPYNRILFSGTFLLFFLLLGSAILRGAGDAKTPMYITFFAVLLNIFLDWVMIFGKLGFPRMEVKGAALATVISRGGAGLFLFILLVIGEHHIRLDIKNYKIDFNIIKKIISIGFPASIQMFIRSSAGVILVKIASLFGTSIIAAYGIGNRVYQLFLMPGFGFADASAAMVGQNLGAFNIKRAEKSVFTAIYYYFLINLTLGIIIFLFSSKITKLFSTEPDVILKGAIYLKFIATGALFASFGLIISRSLQGAGETIVPMVLTGISLYLIQIPFAYFASINLKLNEFGIWLAFPFANLVHASFMLVAFFKSKWRHKSI